MDAIKDLVLRTVHNLVDHIEHVNVEFLEGQAGLYINIMVHEEDKKRIIGKKGGNIQALRTLVHSIAAKDKIKTYVTLIE